LGKEINWFDSIEPERTDDWNSLYTVDTNETTIRFWSRNEKGTVITRDEYTNTDGFGDPELESFDVLSVGGRIAINGFGPLESENEIEEKALAKLESGFGEIKHCGGTNFEMVLSHAGITEEDWDEIARAARFPNDWNRRDPIDGDELGVVEVAFQSVPLDY
jgi:hypothetical protein